MSTLYYLAIDSQFLYFHYSIQVTRVATYKELDHDFEKHTGILTLVRILHFCIVLLITCFICVTQRVILLINSLSLM